jgi:predicted nuclease of predicted toxin-antitoxin system
MTDAEIIKIVIELNQIDIIKDKDFLDYFFAKGFSPKVLKLQSCNIKNNELIANPKVNMEEISKSFY